MPRPKVKLPKACEGFKPMDYRYVTYDYCKSIAMASGLKSAREYLLWYNTFKPGGFPARPDRAYEEWESWDTFLDTGNRPTYEWKGAVLKGELLPYWEAVDKIQKLQFSTVEEYYEAFDAGLIPAGIPKRPALRYSMFYNNGGWKVFLGKNVKHRVVAAQNLQKLFVLYRTVGRSGNIISVMIHSGGMNDLRAKVASMGVEVIKVYVWKDEDATAVFPILDYYGKSQGDDVSWLFSNTGDLFWELQNILELYRE